MSILDILEVEEFVGKHWDRMVADVDSFTRFQEDAVALDDVKNALAVFFRALGGSGGVEIAAAGQERSGHRLTFRQKLGSDGERLPRPTYDGVTMRLPDRVMAFPSKELNRKLYFWLAAYFASAPLPTARGGNRGLTEDLALLRAIHAATDKALNRFPGLRPIRDLLAAAHLRLRPNRPLPPTEQAVEQVIRHMLGDDLPDNPLAHAMWGIVTGGADSIKTAGRYRTFLPVPLWGEALEKAPSLPSTGDEDDEMPEDGQSGNDPSNQKRRAQRRELDQAERDDGFALHIYDKLLAVVDMLNLNRNVDDDDIDDALQAADDLDQLTLAKHDQKPASRLKMDLDLPSDEVDETRLTAVRTVPEWHYRKAKYLPNHCAVVVRTAAEDSDDIWQPDEAAVRRIRQVRRQFEALQTQRETFRRQPDGAEIDIEEAVRARAELAAMGTASDRLYCQSRVASRDLAVSVLVDVSLSTDSWLSNRRVIDVEKEALETFAFGLEACGDDFAINTFTSRKRNYVRVERVKSFGESFSPVVRRRIAALKPGFYTRIGAAVRLAAEELAERPNQQKLLLVITDGKPNDVDHYEGRYGVEDARKAIQEAKRMGLIVFGVTVDQKAQDYFPYIFGRGAYQIVSHADKLAASLPRIYRQLTKV
ncbi:nitric oxide reductase activation protein NorD [Aestuariispira ectoiniformans]|uniref:nitric oxide reductase activation protein NorD n=1 Tax=Aestuariispira ectoiniformans TaxID=2775080 RepID=UPI00223AA849|nr:VWA domain-containing protein [Aestuariispira ectoiniformans]